MFIIVNAGGYSCIVLIPLLSVNSSISVCVVEVSEELHEDLVLSHLATLNLGVHGRVINAAEVVHVNIPVAVTVELEEGFVNHGLATSIGRASNANEELVEVHDAVTVLVEVSE